MIKDYGKFSAIDQKIKSGEIAAAREQLKVLSGKSKSRPDKLIISELSRRVGLPESALHLLFKHVREIGDATAEEKFEYALSLMKLGYYREGRELLERAELRALDRSLYYSAFADIYHWDYESAEKKLAVYRKQNLPEYEALVVDVNLLACKVMAGNPSDAVLKDIELILKVGGKLNAYRLMANALELSAQYSLYAGLNDSAEKALKQAGKILSEDSSIDGFFIKKWRSLSDLKEHRNEKKFVDRVLATRKEAFQLSYWEVARDIDFHLGLWNRNRSVTSHLYFGTPFEHYRKRVAKYFGPAVTREQTYTWRLNQPSRPKLMLDLDSGDLVTAATGKNIACELSGNTHFLRTLRSLSRDFYRPARISSMAEVLYPGEYFEPHSTQNKVHQTIHRLRTALLKAKVPLEVTERDGYKLVTSEPFGLVSYMNYSDNEDPAKMLKQKFHHNLFTSEEASIVLNMSKRGVQTLLGDLVADNRLQKIGLGRSVKYKFI